MYFYLLVAAIIAGIFFTSDTFTPELHSAFNAGAFTFMFIAWAGQCRKTSIKGKSDVKD